MDFGGQQLLALLRQGALAGRGQQAADLLPGLPQQPPQEQQQPQAFHGLQHLDYRDDGGSGRQATGADDLNAWTHHAPSQAHTHQLPLQPTQSPWGRPPPGFGPLPPSDGPQPLGGAPSPEMQPLPPVPPGFFHPWGHLPGAPPSGSNGHGPPLSAPAPLPSLGGIWGTPGCLGGVGGGSSMASASPLSHGMATGSSLGQHSWANGSQSLGGTDSGGGPWLGSNGSVTGPDPGPGPGPGWQQPQHLHAQWPPWDPSPTPTAPPPGLPNPDPHLVPQLLGLREALGDGGWAGAGLPQTRAGGNDDLLRLLQGLTMREDGPSNGEAPPPQLLSAPMAPPSAAQTGLPGDAQMAGQRLLDQLRRALAPAGDMATVTAMQEPRQQDRQGSPPKPAPEGPRARRGGSMQGPSPQQQQQQQRERNGEGRRGAAGPGPKAGLRAPPWDAAALDAELSRLVQELSPSPEELSRLQEALDAIRELLLKEFPDGKVLLYGSAANGLCISRTNDIDVTLALGPEFETDAAKAAVVTRIGEALTASGQADNLLVLPKARVPVVKFVYPPTGTSVDVTVNNELPLANTRLLATYAALDPRLRGLALLVKHWAKTRGVNDTYRGTLSSYAYVLLCIGLLQQRQPPILPTLQQAGPRQPCTIAGWDCSFCDDVDAFEGFGRANTESLAELLHAFFAYWGFQHDYNNAVLSIRTGGLLSKRSKDWVRRQDRDRHLVCIEDPFELSHDLGRCVDWQSVRLLRSEFERAARIMANERDPLPALLMPLSETKK